MNTIKTLILSSTVLIALAILTLTLQFLTRKQAKVSSEGKIKPSFGIWFGGLFLSGTLILQKAIFLFNEAIDNIYKIGAPNNAFAIFKTGSLFIGLGIMWMVIWYFITNILSIIIMGMRNEKKEMENDNSGYFLVKGFLLMGFTICLLPVFEIIIRNFIPTIQLPFYH
jgi:hypothetical protein